ncbi:MAG: hypothetical protein RMJ98_21855, partial [Myxococcales bacterium]|nr:hypothetical protein [Myxococcales bacterium]
EQEPSMLVMHRSMFLALPMFALLLAGCCGRFTGKQSEPSSENTTGTITAMVNGIPVSEIPGTYTGSWGTMHLLVNGTTARAAYDHDNGFFVGQVSPTGIRGTWCQGTKRGPAEFRFQRVGGVIQIDGRWSHQASPNNWIDDWDLTKQKTTHALLAARAPAANCP